MRGSLRTYRSSIGLVCALLTGAVALVSACTDDQPAAGSRAPGSDDAGADDDDAGPSGNGVTALATALCSFQQRCRESVFRTYFKTTADCVASYTLTYERNGVLPGAEGFDAQFSKCAARLKDGTCDTAFTQVPECVFVGSLKDGEPCQSASQCASFACASSAGSVCGSCSPAADPGASCLDRDCAQGLLPEYDYTASPATCTCIFAPTEGRTCTTLCFGLLQCVDHVCKKPLQKGDRCDATSVCSPDRDLVCANGVCAEATRANVDGGCGGSVACLAGDCIGGTCVAHPGVGGPCGGTTGATCPPDLRCRLADGGTTSTCTRPAADECK